MEINCIQSSWNIFWVDTLHFKTQATSIHEEKRHVTKVFAIAGLDDRSIGRKSLLLQFGLDVQ
jgi:hypothetical protein